MGVNQVEKVALNDLVRKDHPYRRLKTVLDFDKIQHSVKVNFPSRIKRYFDITCQNI